MPEYRELAAYLQRDILIENPNVKFTDIIGLDDAKRLIKEAVMLPLKYPDYFTGILEPWRGVLLFGPPGTGKVKFYIIQRQCLLNQSPHNAKPHSSISQHLQWCQNGEDKVRN